MNAPATIAPLDEFATFLGEIPPEEYARRALLRKHRNAASAFVGSTESDTARLLAWQVIEWASPYLYQPGLPLDWLDHLNLLSKRLMLTAMQAEEMDDLLRGDAHG